MKALLCNAAAILLFATICLTVFTTPNFAADSDKADSCRLFPNGTEVGDPESCSRYIKCIDGVSHYFECPTKTPLYNKDTGKCVATLKDSTACTINCTESTEKFITDPKSCRGYYYCFDEEFAQPGACPVDTHFNESAQMCVHNTDSNCKVESFDVCTNVKNDVNFKDEHNCHMYYTCAKGKLTSKTCKTGYYDAVIGACVAKSLADCPAHPLPKNVCGTDKKPLKKKFVSDEATCRGYFYCRDMDTVADDNPSWGQCGEDTFFDATTETCKDPLEVKCDEDRCDGRSKVFVSSGTKGCRNYLRCSEGITLAELTCGNNFYDEKMNACVNSIVSYTSCKG